MDPGWTRTILSRPVGRTKRESENKVNDQSRKPKKKIDNYCLMIQKAYTGQFLYATNIPRVGVFCLPFSLFFFFLSVTCSSRASHKSCGRHSHSPFDYVLSAYQLGLPFPDIARYRRKYLIICLAAFSKKLVLYEVKLTSN